MKTIIYNQICEKYPKFQPLILWNLFSSKFSLSKELSENNWQEIDQILTDFEEKEKIEMEEKTQKEMILQVEKLKDEKIKNQIKLNFDEVSEIIGKRKFSKKKDSDFYKYILEQTEAKSKTKIDRLFGKN